MGRIFGTDGARGVANTEISCTLAMDIGRAAAMVVARDHHKRKPVFLVGHDTRISHDMLESAIAAGLCSVGADVVTLGTPEGVGPMQPGDVIEVRIGGIGTLKNTVKAEE